MAGSQRGADSQGPLIVFAGGGTGGHLFPAVALVEAFRLRMPHVRVRFLGTERAIDQKVLKTVDGDFLPQRLPPLSNHPWRWPRIIWALREVCRSIRGQFRMDPPIAVIGTGGLASVPAVWVSRRMGIPAYLLNPDAIPGRANRRLARLVRAVFAQWSDTVSHGHFQHCRVRVHGCPVRTTFRTAQRTDGQQRFGLSPSLRTLLITGASQGARTINEAVTANSAFLASLSGWQILHLTGEADFESVKGAYKAGGVHATVIPFTHHMPEALAVADLVISRAGASTLAEITALGRASILMPYPFHRDRHQTANALCLVRRNAAVFVEDSKTAAVNAPRLLAALRSATADGEQRDAMAKAARALGKPGAAERIVDDIIALGAQRGSVIASESLEVSSCGIR